MYTWNRVAHIEKKPSNQRSKGIVGGPDETRTRDPPDVSGQVFCRMMLVLQELIT